MFDMTGKTVVLSGAGGVGREILRGFLEMGMNAAIFSSSKEKGEQSRSMLPEHLQARCKAFGCVVEDPDLTRAALEEVIKTFGGIDVLVNGAGAHGKENIFDTQYDRWEHGLGNQISSPFVMIKEAIPFLKLSTAPRVINLATVEARTGRGIEGISAATGKGAVIALTKAAAFDLATFGITVNCVAVGPVEGDGPWKTEQEDIDRMCKLTPLGRLAVPADIAPAVWFLASEEARFITGIVIDVNGGMYMG